MSLGIIYVESVTSNVEMIQRNRFKIKHDSTINLCLTILKFSGFWTPTINEGCKRKIYSFYTIFVFTFILGIYILIQAVDLYEVRGDIPLMTADAFLLFTNLVQTIKIANILSKRGIIEENIYNINILIDQNICEDTKKIIDKYAIAAFRDFVSFASLTYTTLILWVAGPLFFTQNSDVRLLPLNAWYPYNTQISPQYEITYAHQVIAIYIAATLNVIKDCLAVSLINQIACQLELVKFSLLHITDNSKNDKTLNYHNTDNEKLTEHHMPEEILYEKTRSCIIHHQKVLNIAEQIEYCFSFTIFIQFSVSLIIICVTAFQLAMQIGNNIINTFGIGLYLLNMIYQVFLYCWRGNEAIKMSTDLITSAYFCYWYTYSPRTIKLLKIFMIRCQRPIRLTAGGFTTLSIKTFMSIIKASYSYFTVLQQLNDNKI